jgi:hypothetical protein
MEIIVIDRPDQRIKWAGKADSGRWYRNSLAFATKQEALDNAHNLAARWTLVRRVRSVESDEPVTYSYHDRQLRHVGGAVVKYMQSGARLMTKNTLALLAAGMLATSAAAAADKSPHELVGAWCRISQTEKSFTYQHAPVRRDRCAGEDDWMGIFKSGDFSIWSGDCKLTGRKNRWWQYKCDYEDGQAKDAVKFKYDRATGHLTVEYR